MTTQENKEKTERRREENEENVRGEARGRKVWNLRLLQVAGGCRGQGKGRGKEDGREERGDG